MQALRSISRTIALSTCSPGSLTRLYDTDKVGRGRIFEVYARAFAALRWRPIRLLELGVHRGGSLLLWRDFFPFARIVGLDIEPTNIQDPTGRIRFYRGRQEDCALLTRIAAEQAPGGFDIVIDDASHFEEPTRASFWHLFDHHLKPGGTYALEDWEVGYRGSWPGGRAYGSLARDGAPSRSHDAGLVGFAKELVDVLSLGDQARSVLGVPPAPGPRSPPCTSRATRFLCVKRVRRSNGRFTNDRCALVQGRTRQEQRKRLRSALSEL